MKRLPTVLVSDARPHDGVSLLDLGRQCGLSILTDTSGRVVELARRYVPSLIVLDVQQRAGDGLQLLAELRQNPVTRLIPVLATGRVDDEFTVSVCAELNAAFLLKPFNAEFGALLSDLAHGRRRGALPPKEIPLMGARR